MVVPVVRQLRADARALGLDLHIDVLGLPAATYTLRSADVPYLGFADFLDPLKDGDAIAWGEELAATHHSPTVGVSLEDSIAYLGLNFKDLVLRHGLAQANALLESRGRHAFFPLTVMERVFRRVRPDMVVTSNSPRSEAAAIATANAQGIDNLIMTDLFTGLGGYVMRGRAVSFLNEVARDMFLADGLVDPSRSELHCTGNPAFDRLLAKPLARQPEWLARQFPGLANPYAVLHADMPAWWDAAAKRSYTKSRDETIAELDACWRAARAQGAAYLIRPHPSQERALYEAWVADREDAWLAADCDLHDLLVHADLVLARSTTVALEACLLQRPVLQLEHRRHPDLPLAAMGAAWGSEGFPTLPVELGRALQDRDGAAALATRARKMLPFEPAAPKLAALILQRLDCPQPAPTRGSP